MEGEESFWVERVANEGGQGGRWMEGWIEGGGVERGGREGGPHRLIRSEGREGSSSPD